MNTQLMEQGARFRPSRNLADFSEVSTKLEERSRKHKLLCELTPTPIAIQQTKYTIGGGGQFTDALRAITYVVLPSSISYLFI